MLLTKSDFQVARACSTKLYYRKKRYPSNLQDDDFLRFLADGGYMVEEIARAKFPDGAFMPMDPLPEALSQTQRAMEAANVTLFEASFCAGQLFARVDILKKAGNEIRIIEVKAKSFDSGDDPNVFRGVKGAIRSEWRSYLEDVTFQAMVLARLYPDMTIVPCLCVVDKSAICEAGMQFKNFELIRDPDQRRTSVKFAGDRELLRSASYVQIREVTSEVEELLPEVSAAADELVRTLESGEAVRTPPKLGRHCKHCEYRPKPEKTLEPSGFHECWGELANHEFHLLDLYRVDSLGDENIDHLISLGKTALSHIRPNSLLSAHSSRQSLQIRCTAQGIEYVDPALPGKLKRCRYPLHFVDFESSRLAVPYHEGMRPYEQVLFQWSCHTISEPGATPVHHEWINLDDAFPNFAFARTLRNTLARPGTVFVWSGFEQTALQDVRNQLLNYGEPDADLDEWLASVGPIVDLCELARDHYFHPQMRGSVSIKYVLPAIWSSTPSLRSHPWFTEYAVADGSSHLSPYATLPELPFGDEYEDKAVREGTGAMRTYQEMMYGARRNDAEFRELQKRALLNYCKLDTAAMVMIWMKWIGSV